MRLTKLLRRRRDKKLTKDAIARDSMRTRGFTEIWKTAVVSEILEIVPRNPIDATNTKTMASGSVDYHATSKKIRTAQAI